MEFKSYDQLKEYVGKWLSESDLEQLWKWVQKDMVTNEQVVQITEKCCCDEECMTESYKQNAWQAFISNYTKK